MAFTFGLLHGFGFAGALKEIGLPQGDVPLALLTFNLGVEAGQLLFVGAILLLYAAINAAVSWPLAKGRVAAAYVIGTVATIWLAGTTGCIHAGVSASSASLGRLTISGLGHSRHFGHVRWKSAQSVNTKRRDRQ